MTEHWSLNDGNSDSSKQIKLYLLHEMNIKIAATYQEKCIMHVCESSKFCIIFFIMSVSSAYSTEKRNVLALREGDHSKTLL